MMNPTIACSRFESRHGDPRDVTRTYVSLPFYVKRVSLRIDLAEVNVVCEDTGEVVYCTPVGYRVWPSRALRTSPWQTAVGAARLRAEQWLKAHRFAYDPCDRGYYTREVAS